MTIKELERIEEFRKNKIYMILYNDESSYCKTVPLVHTNYINYSDDNEFCLMVDKSRNQNNQNRVLILKEEINLNKIVKTKGKDCFKYNPKQKKYSKSYKSYETTNNLHFKKISKEIKINYLSDEKTFKDKDGNSFNYWLANIEMPNNFEFYKKNLSK